MRNTKSSQMKKRICYLMAVGALIPLGLMSRRVDWLPDQVGDMLWTGSCRNIDLLVPRRIPAVGPLGMARRPAVHHAGAPRPGARFPLAGFGCLCPWHSTHLSLGKNGRKERNNSMKWAKIALQGFSFELFFFCRIHKIDDICTRTNYE